MWLACLSLYPPPDSSVSVLLCLMLSVLLPFLTSLNLIRYFYAIAYFSTKMYLKIILVVSLWLKTYNLKTCKSLLLHSDWPHSVPLELLLCILYGYKSELLGYYSHCFEYSLCISILTFGVHFLHIIFPPEIFLYRSPFTFYFSLDILVEK